MDEAQSARNKRLYVLSACVLLMAGLLSFYAYGSRDAARGNLILMACTGFATWFAFRFKMLNYLRPLRQPTGRYRRLISGLIFVGSFAYLVYANVTFGRSLEPYWHDDQMHAVQARMFASGYLSMPEHPLSDFFDTFHVFVRPFYAGIHFMGTTLLNAPGFTLHLPIWIIPCLTAAAAVWLVYEIILQLIDGVYALAGVLLVLSSDMFRYIALRMTSHVPEMMLGMLLLWAWLRWRKSGHKGWLWLMGVSAGMATITRPIDSLAFVLPVVVAMLADAKYSIRAKARQATVCVLCAVPFVAFQLYANFAVTGNALYPPYQKYVDEYWPGLNYGRADSAEDKASATAHVKISSLPQKQAYYDMWMRPQRTFYESVSMTNLIFDYRLPITLIHALPDTLLFILLPLGILSIKSTGRLVVASTSVLYFVLYLPHYFYLTHYVPIISCGVILLLLLSVETLVKLVPRRAKMIEAGFLCLIPLASLSTMPPFIRVGRDEAGGEMEQTAFINRDANGLIKRPAIVMITSGRNHHDEPVYNYAAAKIDDNPVIRAQFLGPRNIELYAYYAKRQPDRNVYVYDRMRNVIASLGKVSDVYARELATLRATPTSQPAIQQDNK